MVMRTTFAQDSSALLGLLGAVVGLLIGEGLDTGRSNRNALCGVLTECGRERPSSKVTESGRSRALSTRPEPLPLASNRHCNRSCSISVAGVTSLACLANAHAMRSAGQSRAFFDPSRI